MVWSRRSQWCMSLAHTAMPVMDSGAKIMKYWLDAI